MDIQASPGGNPQKLTFEHLPEGHYHEKIRLEFPDRPAESGFRRIFRLKKVQVHLPGCLLDRGRGGCFGPPFWPIRLGYHGKDVMSRTHQGIKRCHGILRSAHEDDFWMSGKRSLVGSGQKRHAAKFLILLCSFS